MFLQKQPCAEDDEDGVETFEGKETAQVPIGEQTEPQKKPAAQQSDAAGETAGAHRRRSHSAFQQQLPGDEQQLRQSGEPNRNGAHNSTFVIMIMRAMHAVPARTEAMPIHRRSEMASPRNIHAPSGTRTCAMLIRPNATLIGM